MSWCFGLVNNRLAEIFYKRNKSVVTYMGHAFVKKTDYTSKREKEWIVKDTARIRLTYENGVYKEM